MYIRWPRLLIVAVVSHLCSETRPKSCEDGAQWIAKNGGLRLPRYFDMYLHRPSVNSLNPLRGNEGDSTVIVKIHNLVCDRYLAKLRPIARMKSIPLSIRAYVAMPTYVGGVRCTYLFATNHAEAVRYRRVMAVRFVLAPMECALHTGWL